MAIFVPGKRGKDNRPIAKGGRSAIASLSLTAMVDMFTVLTIFLLQFPLGEVVHVEKDMELPKATKTKELKASHVVVVSTQGIKLDKVLVVSFDQVKEQKDWMIENLFNAMAQIFVNEQKLNSGTSIREVIQSARKGEKPKEKLRKVTLQADKNIDFLTIKKVMYTLTEAGATEINFAVIQTQETLDDQLEELDEG